MIRKKIILSSAFAATLYSATLMADDSHSLTEFQKTSPTPFLETALATTNGGTQCVMIDDSTAAAWNSGKICLVSSFATSTTDFSVATDLRIAGSSESQDIFGERSTPGAECVSAGGSKAASENDGGFCLTSDLSTSETDFANFSFANDSPVTGMQFLQATFGDGSTQSVSAPIGSECISSGGSTSTTENAEGFCLASDLSISITEFANFSVANGLPMVGLQFLQVIFADSSLLDGSLLLDIDSECVSVGGSIAATGKTGGFCLAADISTATADLANFSVANYAPVTNMQFLQVTFGNGSLPGALPSSPGAGAPVGAECISIDGSIAAIGNPVGFCLVSDLIRSSTGSANIAFANDLPVSGLHFLQATFGDDGSLPSPGDGALNGAECVSDDGSTAATGNPKGFCMVSDLITSTMGSANFSVANDLPVTAWEFLQAPSEAGAPVGIVVSDFMVLPFDLRSPSALAGIVGRQTPYFHLSDQTSGMEAYSTPYWRLYPHLGFWINR